MKVKILGALAVEREGKFITPSAPKLRSLLCLLALNAGGTVSKRQIVAELWDENPPISAMTTMQTYVYHLRKLFQCRAEPTEPTATIQTMYGGYRLNTPQRYLDSQSFEELSNRGRADLESDKVSDAAEHLRTALALWRGPAFADMVRGPLLNAEAVRLEEIRLGTLEARISADLRLGRFHEVTSELTHLVAQQPTHEGFQEKLMTALNSMGRRSEALAVYQRARAALAEELGLEPSAELQYVQRTILEGGSSRDQGQERTAAPAVTGSAPDSVPRASGGLVGRDQLLKETEHTLREGGDRTRIIAVSGLPGGGKTAFAVHLAQRVRDLYPDGQFYIRLQRLDGHPSTADQVLFELLRMAGFPKQAVPRSTAEKAALFRGWSSQRSVLLVLDDAVSTAQFEQLLPTGSGSAALVVGRRRLADLTITDMVDLPALENGDAHRLLAICAGGTPDEGGRTAVDELVDLCGGLPRALHEVARCLRSRAHWSPERVARHFRGERERLRVGSSVARSMCLLDDHERVVLDTLAGQAGTPFSSSAVAEDLGTTEEAAEAALEDLLEFGLVRLSPQPQPEGEEPVFRYVLPQIMSTERDARGSLPADDTVAA